MDEKEIYVGVYVEMKKEDTLEIITSYTTVCSFNACKNFEKKIKSDYCPDCGKKCSRKEINKYVPISIYSILDDIDKIDTIIDFNINNKVICISNFTNKNLIDSEDVFEENLENIDMEKEKEDFIEKNSLFLQALNTLNIKFKINYGVIGYYS